MKTFKIIFCIILLNNCILTNMMLQNAQDYQANFSSVNDFNEIENVEMDDNKSFRFTRKGSRSCVNGSKVFSGNYNLSFSYYGNDNDCEFFKSRNSIKGERVFSELKNTSIYYSGNIIDFSNIKTKEKFLNYDFLYSHTVIESKFLNSTLLSMEITYDSKYLFATNEKRQVILYDIHSGNSCIRIVENSKTNIELIKFYKKKLIQLPIIKPKNGFYISLHDYSRRSYYRFEKNHGSINKNEYSLHDLELQFSVQQIREGNPAFYILVPIAFIGDFVITPVYLIYFALYILFK